MTTKTSSIPKKIGTAVVGFAILIGSIGKFAPHLFMNLPFPLSIILWASTGNSMPPYFMDDAWKEDEIDSWMKDGDLVVATGAKSGTTWMLYCTHQIRTNGTDLDDELYPDVSLTTPWPDLRQSRKANWIQQKERLNTTILPDGRALRDLWDHPSYSFRIFKSHFAPPDLPVTKKGGKKIKYMAMARNGIDVAASMTPFYSAHTDRFRNLWGGFPPVIDESSYDSDEPPAAVKDILPGGPLGFFYFGYVKKWWEYRKEPNVILLHYSDIRKDLKGGVKRIAKFLDVDLNPKELNTVTERCGIEHMRKANKFLYRLPLNDDPEALWDLEKDHIIKSGSFVKKGGIGTGAAIFSDKVVAQWKKAEEDEFGHNPALLKWAREGGDFPSE